MCPTDDALLGRSSARIRQEPRAGREQERGRWQGQLDLQLQVETGPSSGSTADPRAAFARPTNGSNGGNQHFNSSRPNGREAPKADLSRNAARPPLSTPKQTFRMFTTSEPDIGKSSGAYLPNKSGATFVPRQAFQRLRPGRSDPARLKSPYRTIGVASSRNAAS